MPSIVFESVTHKRVLTDVSQSWSAGSMVGIVGPNGAGKSTLLRMIAGVWAPERGEIRLDGRPVLGYTFRERARHLAYLPQQIPDDVPYTVQEFVEMGRYAHQSLWFQRQAGSVRAGSAAAAGLAASDGAALAGLASDGSAATTGASDADRGPSVKAALTRMNLLDLAAVPLQQLSGGERQRVAVARCLAQGSPVIVLDEPTSNLDLFYQLDILRQLRALAAEGYLVVLAIHHLELAAQFCSELVLLHEGRVVASGDPVSVLNETNVKSVFHMDVRMYRDPFADSLRLSFPS